MAKLGDGSLSGLQKLRTLYHQGPNGHIDTAVKFLQSEVYHEGMRLLIGRESKSTGFTGVDENGNTYANPSKYGPENNAILVPILPKCLVILAILPQAICDTLTNFPPASGSIPSKPSTRALIFGPIF